MELRIVTGRDALPLDTRLHPSYLAHAVLAERVSVHERLDERGEAAAELGVARDWSRS